jgi:hypothetical protein
MRMKNVTLLLGIVIGFALGSRAGREPYEQIEAQVRKIVGRPEVQRAIDKVSEAGSQLADAAVGPAQGVAKTVKDRAEKLTPSE